MKHVILICSIPFFVSVLAKAQDAPHRVGGDVSAPRLVFKTEPTYTEEARKAGVETTVVAILTVREDGSPTKIRIARGAGFGLDETAIEAIEAWRFSPGMKEGRPIPIMASVEVHFRLMNRNHENQVARLNFTLQQGASRPELKSGEIPANPDTPGDQWLRIRLQVSAEGKAQNLTVLDATNDKWEQAVLHKLKSWRFHPSMLQGSAVEAEGIFELTHGRERPPAKK
jgi:TonB family protein